MERGFNTITSYGMYLPQMHPAGVSEYSYGEVWWGLYEQVDLYRDVPEEYRHLVLGGGAAEWQEAAWGEQMISHSFNRASAIAEILWSNPANRSVNDANARMFSMKCKMEAAGVPSGPTNHDFPNDMPCPGYLWNEM